jgi:hypothetical protein
VRPKTLDGYRGLIRLYRIPGPSETFGSLSSDRWRFKACTASCSSGDSRPGPVVSLHPVLAQALGQAERWDLITWNPVASA